jgi:1,2-diacylglycerol 3-alpha-glucosyltransferase
MVISGDSTWSLDVTDPLPPRSGRKRYSVAMVAACPFPANHGSAASIREMSDTLADMGHNVHIVTYAIGQPDIQVRRAKVHRTGQFQPEMDAKVGPSLEKFASDFHLLRLLVRVIRSERIDIIHAHNYEGALVGIVTKWITGRPLLYNGVNLMSDELATYRFIRPRWLAHALARALDWFVPIFPDHITAVSAELKQWLVDHGQREEKIDFVPAGIHPEMFEHPDRDKFEAQLNVYGRPVVMYTGVLSAFQRVDYLLRAFKEVLRERPDAVLVILSPLVCPSDEGQLRKLADELCIGHAVRWLAPHLLQDLPSYLTLADVTVLPRPDCPGHPIKLLNYMLAGKPTVCFAGAAKGVRHLHDAFVVEDHDWQALGRGIATLLRDRALAARLGANARETVLTEFDWRQICPKIERIYDRLVGPATQPGSVEADRAITAQF